MLINIDLVENSIWHCHWHSELDTANAWLQRKTESEDFCSGLVHRWLHADPGDGSKLTRHAAHPLAGTEQPGRTAVQTGEIIS